MKLTQLLLDELDRESLGIRKALERVPEGKTTGSRTKSRCQLGRLATLVATTPAWLDMVVNLDEIDINPPDGPKWKPQDGNSRAELLAQFEASLKKGAKSSMATTYDHLLNTNWRMLSAGKVISRSAALRRQSAMASSTIWPTTADNSPVYLRLKRSPRSPPSMALSRRRQTRNRGKEGKAA